MQGKILLRENIIETKKIY